MMFVYFWCNVQLISCRNISPLLSLLCSLPSLLSRLPSPVSPLSVETYVSDIDFLWQFYEEAVKLWIGFNSCCPDEIFSKVSLFKVNVYWFIDYSLVMSENSLRWEVRGVLQSVWRWLSSNLASPLPTTRHSEPIQQQTEIWIIC